MSHTKTSKKVKIESVATTFAITNNTQIAIVVVDASAANADDTSIFFDRPLSLLSATDGASQIKAGETKSYSSPSLDGKDHSIIAAHAHNLFPVKIIESAADNDSYTDTIITSADLTNMEGAENFVQAIMAFPSTTMASEFATVLQTNDGARVDLFFNKYPQYGAITLDHVAAIQTYYNRYAFVWAGYGATQSFDIYTSNDGTTKKNLGTVTISNSVVSPISNLDTQAGFTAVYTDQNHRKTTLSYSDRQFSEDLSSATPKICLEGMFVMLSQLTGLSTDNRIVPVLFGSINDSQIFGVSGSYSNGSPLNTQLMGTESITSDTKNYFDSLGLYGWLKLIGITLGVIAGVVALTLTVRYFYKKMTKAPALTPDEVARRNRQRVQDAVRRMDPQSRGGLNVPDDLNRSIADVKQKATDRINRENWFKTSEVLNQQAALAQDLLKYGKNSTMDKVVKSTYDDAEILGDTPRDLSTDMPGLLDHIKANNTAIAKRVGDVTKKLSEGDAKMLTDARDAAETLSNRVIENEKIRQDLKEDDMPEIIDE